MFKSARQSMVAKSTEERENMEGNKQQFNAIKSAVASSVNNEKMTKVPTNASPEYDILRTDYERLMVQQLNLTETLNEKDDQISSFKKKEKSLNEAMTHKEKQHQENAVITL